MPASHRDPFSSISSLSPYSPSPSLSHSSHGGVGGGDSSSAGRDRPRDRDAEDLSRQLRALKEVHNGVVSDNAALKAQVHRLSQSLRRKDAQMDALMSMKVSAVSDSGSDAVLAGQLRELRSELASIARLSAQNRDLESTLARREEELRSLRHSLKFTSARESEVEAATYYAELRRNRKQLLSLQQQVRMLQAELAAAQMPPSPRLLSAAFDAQAHASLRGEVEVLRAENMRLRAERSASAASADQTSPSRQGSRAALNASGLHVLHAMDQLAAHAAAAAADGAGADRGAEQWASPPRSTGPPFASSTASPYTSSPVRARPSSAPRSSSSTRVTAPPPSWRPQKRY